MQDLGLFPLASVLFPGGKLSLRIFEPRYLDLVRDCAAAARPFGLVAIADGHESGVSATPHSIGTLALIVDFTTLPDGLLGITCQGGERFRIESRRVAQNRLQHAQVELLAPDPVLEVPAEFGLLATLLRRAADQIEGLLSGAANSAFDDAAWVAYRLAEILPLELSEKQQLLEADDPIERLALLAQWLPRFQR